MANPGCYPTAANLAIRPLLDAGVVDRAAGIVCDAKIAASAARAARPTPQDQLLRGDGEFLGLFDPAPPARAGGAAGQRLGRRRVQLYGAAAADRPRHPGDHLFPRQRASSAEDLLAIYEKRYAGEPFIRLYQPGHVPDLHAVARTNFCDIGVTLDAANGPRGGGERHR